jgi:hypothetical protein
MTALAAIIAFINSIAPLIPGWVQAGINVIGIIEGIEKMIAASGAPAADQLAAANTAVASLRAQVQVELDALKQTAPNS